MKQLSRFAKDETGATAIEYGLIALLISVAIIAILRSVGLSLVNVFRTVNNALSAAK